MIIATDIDEVLADTLNEFLAFYNANFGTDFSRERFTSYDWWEGLGITAEEFIVRLRQFTDTGGFTRVAPIPGSQAGIKRLSNDHKLIVVTSRPRVLAEGTVGWLGKHYGNCFKEVYYTKEFIGEANRLSKATFCMQEGVELFIDDVYEYAAGCAACGIEALLYDAPWNRDRGLISNMMRVCSWTDIMGEIDNRLAKAMAEKVTTIYDDRIKL